MEDYKNLKEWIKQEREKHPARPLPDDYNSHYDVGYEYGIMDTLNSLEVWVYAEEAALDQRINEAYERFHKRYIGGG